MAARLTGMCREFWHGTWRHNWHLLKNFPQIILTVLGLWAEICVLMLKTVAALALLKMLGYELPLSPEWANLANEIPVNDAGLAILIMLLPTRWASRLLAGR